MKIYKCFWHIWQIHLQFSNISTTLGHTGRAFFHVWVGVDEIKNKANSVKQSWSWD